MLHYLLSPLLSIWDIEKYLLEDLQPCLNTRSGKVEISLQRNKKTGSLAAYDKTRASPCSIERIWNSYKERPTARAAACDGSSKERALSGRLFVKSDSWNFHRFRTHYLEKKLSSDVFVINIENETSLQLKNEDYEASDFISAVLVIV